MGNRVDGPNGAIDAPILNPPTNTTLGGNGAAANATLSVFETVTERGDVKEFVASELDVDGVAWMVTFPSSLPNGQCVSATQTDAQRQHLGASRRARDQRGGV